MDIYPTSSRESASKIITNQMLAWQAVALGSYIIQVQCDEHNMLLIFV